MKTKRYPGSRLLMLCLLLFPLSHFVSAQQVAKSFTATDGTFLGFYEFKPAGYNESPSKKYPLIIFLHGIGERGNGTSELPYLTWQGIPNLISRGATMTFTNPNTRQSESFLVLSPQLPKNKGAWENVYVDEMLKYAKANLQVDTNKIFLTGLSLGGGGVWSYANTSVEHAKKLAAIAPICGVCYYNYGTLCSTIGAANIGVWGFTNADDNVVSPVCTIQAVDALSGCNPTKVKKTVYPWGGHDSWTKAYDTGHTIQTDINLYEWFLSNAKTAVTPTPNQAPVAQAGSNVSVTLPSNSVNLSGAASKDNDGSISSYSWSKVSGPAQFNIVTPSAAATTVNNLVEGVYVFKLTVTDNNGATGTATVQVTVYPAPLPANVSPVAKPGTAVSITLPVNSTTLNGTASYDPDGSLVSYAWSKVSGPSQYTLASPTAATTALSNLVQGVYEFSLTVTDNRGGTASANVQVTVHAAPVPVNQPPVANAGSAVTILLPLNSVPLNGSNSKDPDGTISNYIWTKASGPASFIIVNSQSPNTIINGLVEGVYIFTLTVTDDKGATSAADVQITVKPAVPPANIAPVANAGTAATITLPINTANLNGAASSDQDGSITTYSWTKVSGPTQFAITNSSQANTTVTNLVEGVYIFRLTVTDNAGATAAASVQVTVNAALPPANQPPVANAGKPVTITLPVNSVTLDGSLSYDAEAPIVSYSWTKTAGPVSFGIVSPLSATTVVNSLTEGVYSFTLTVTDNKGVTAKASVQVTVLPKVNNPPVARAGTDRILNQAAEVVLDGSSSSDPDGQITGYNWKQVSGLSGVNLLNTNSSKAIAQGLIAGEYIFRLTVTDNAGMSASDDVKISIVPAQNKRPKASAGNDTSVSLPATTALLNGSGSSDPEGMISSYSWRQIAGPTSALVANNVARITEVRELAEGEYVFVLTVTDDRGLSAADTVGVTVINTFRVTQYYNLYPNPVKDLLHVRYIYDKNGPVVLTIYNMNGVPVKTLRVDKKSMMIDMQVDVKDLRVGFYHLELTAADGQKAIKQFLKR
jgi:predicted esterase